MAEYLSNAYASTLGGAITNVATTLVVASASGAPSYPARYIIKGEGSNKDEIVLVTNISGTTFTVTRAVEPIADGTQAMQPHASGATIAQVLTVAGLRATTEVVDLLTGNDKLFTSTVGNWTNSGGTLTRDTTSGYKLFNTMAASLKFVTTTSAHYIEVPVTGTFLTAVEYHALLAVRVEELAADYGATFSVEFGAIGGDSNTFTMDSYGGEAFLNGTSGQYMMVIVRWTPVSNVTNAKVRLKRVDSETQTLTYHVGFARVFQAPFGVGAFLTQPLVPTTQGNGGNSAVGGMGLMAVLGSQGASIDMGGKTDRGLLFDNYGSVRLVDSTGTTSVGGAANKARLVASHTAGSLKGQGVQLTLGTDYIGLYISEKDSSTVQIYADNSNGYDVELRDRGTGKGFKAADSSGNSTGLLSKAPWRSLSAAPSTPAEADCYYNTTTHKLMIWDGSAWQACW